MRQSLVGVLLLLAWVKPALGHEVLQTVERGRAVAVKAFFPDGEPLAYAECEVFSPADAKIPYQKGRTDRDGFVAFVPSLAGKWRVKITDSTGHGLDTTVDVASTGQPAAGGGLSNAAFILRPVAGALAIAAIFLVLARARRRRTPPS